MSLLNPPLIAPIECPPYPVWRFSVDDYHRLIAGGILGEDDRFELLEGWIVPKRTHNPLHDGRIQIVSAVLARLLPVGWAICIQSAITTGDSEPGPDIAVVRSDARTYLTRHPGPADIGLIVEVAESSLEQDRQQKSRIYARAGIRAYWIVNLVDRQIEVFADPTGVGDTATFATRAIHRAGEFVLSLDEQIVASLSSTDLLS